MMTGDEWLAAHDEAMAAEDPHRQVTEDDVVVEPVEQVEEVEAVEHEHQLETDVPDARDQADAAPVQRAHLAIAELVQRQAAEEREQEDRDARWHTEAAEREAAAAQKDGPTLERV